MRCSRGGSLRELFRNEGGQLGRLQAPVDPLDHAAVGMARHRREQMRRNARSSQPREAGAAQVVRAAGLDADALACFPKVTPDVLPS